jgi:hypothetical protein
MLSQKSPIEGVNMHFRWTAMILSSALLCCGAAVHAQEGETSTEPLQWDWGVSGGMGYFNFRNSLFVRPDPDPPSNLSEDWFEFFVKPWISFSYRSGGGEWFGEAAWAYVRTDDAAADIAGGGADSADLDQLYLGWRSVDGEHGDFEVAAGRYPYQIARGFLISDGYADGGSRGGLWSNARKAWAPGAKAMYSRSGHQLEVFYLDRDERPESDSEIRISGVNYQWQNADEAWTLGASFLRTRANELKLTLDGADILNLRAYSRPFGVPLDIDGEWVRQDNGPLLDANAWYLQTAWTWEDAAWQPKLYYRYALFEGDDPNTLANENYEPMFPAFYDWGSWWQGEIAGEYFLSNSNLRTHMLRLHTVPRDNVSSGLIYFDYRLDQPASYQGGVSTRDLARELNWYLDWKINPMFTASFVLARNQPGKAVEEAFGRTESFRYFMVYLGFALP